MKRVMIACEYVWKVAAVIFLGCAIVTVVEAAVELLLGYSIANCYNQQDRLMFSPVIIITTAIACIALPDLAWWVYKKSWAVANLALFRTHGYGLGEARPIRIPTLRIDLVSILAFVHASSSYQLIPGYTQIVWATGILCGLVLIILVGYAVITKIGHSRGWIEYVKPKTFAVYTVIADENGSPAMQHMEEHIATPEDTIFR